MLLVHRDILAAFQNLHHFVVLLIELLQERQILL